VESFRYRVSHGIAQKQYVLWKHNKLSRLCQTTQPPKEVKDKKGIVSVEFYTSSGAYLQELFNLFYRPSPLDGEKFLKTITPELIDKLPLDPILLAVLFMDDGSVRNDCYAGKLATQCYSLLEQNLLKDYLKEKWKIETNIVRHTQKSGQYYLSIPKKGFSCLIELIEPIVKEIPCMAYKCNEVNKPKSNNQPRND